MTSTLRAEGENKEGFRLFLQPVTDTFFETLGVPDLINRLVANGHAPQVQYISGHWMDINDVHDLSRAGGFTQGELR